MDPRRPQGNNKCCNLEYIFRNLADRDLLSKSDPICVMYTRPPGSKSWVQVLRTEVVFDDLNPDFARKVSIQGFL